jgi:twinkle protein
MGDEMTVQEYINRKGFEWKRRGEEAILNCPFCEDREKKLSINLSTGLFQCFHANKCGVSGSFTDFQRKLGDKPVSLKEKDIFYNPPKKKQYRKPSVSIVQPTNEVVAYLHHRGFTDETIAHFKIGSENGEAVSFPYYRNGELINVKYRSIKEKAFWAIKDAELILFNRDNIMDDKLVICEGEFDAMALHQYGLGAVSVPGGASNIQWVESEWDYLETFSLIYLCYDNDDAGQQGARDLAVKLGEWRCKLVTLPFKDANECLMKGIGKDAIDSCFDSAVDFKPDSLVTPMFFVERVQNLFRKGVGLFGTKTPWEKVNNILKGWRDGELTVWSGQNGSGKSTILNQVFIDLAEKGVKTCIYSGEMPPERYLRWAIIQYLENEAPSPDRVKSTLEWLSSRVLILNITSGIEQDKLLSDFEYASKRYGMKHFIIDSLMKINFSAQDEYRQQKDFTNKLCGFVKKHGVHVHLVAHPRKTESDDDVMGKVDIKGSSHITDLADNVIVLHRLSEEKKEKTRKRKLIPADMRLFIKKNREFGVEGVVNMAFDEHTKKFTD